MKRFIKKIKKGMAVGKDADSDEVENEYLELDTESGFSGSQKVNVRFFSLDDFADTKPILDSLREGYSIALVNIRPLKEKDLVELKRAINKLKKTTDAIDGDIAGFGEDYVVLTPGFAKIHRSQAVSKPAEL